MDNIDKFEINLINVREPAGRWSPLATSLELSTERLSPPASFCLHQGEDIVPMFDRLQGLIMQMRCPMASPLDCHQLGVTICDLVHK